MDDIEYETSSIRQINRCVIAQDNESEKLISEMHKVEEFLSDFGFLSFGRDFVLCGKNTFSLQMVITSCELTAGSIISCCEFGCMADAYSLLRKYRDDMFFYLYVVVYDTCNKLENNSKLVAQMEKNIERWVNNNLDDLYIGDILMAIGQSPRAKDAVQKYKLKSYFDTIGNRLNNYVHSNGVLFYNRNVNAYQRDHLQKHIQELLKDMRFITITFLFLLTLCSPSSIMSTDYIDSLDCGLKPEEDSEYWVAPFVEKYIKENIGLINQSCLNYLRENTSMEL